MLPKHDAPGPFDVVADFVGEAERLVGAGREQRGVDQADDLEVRRQVVVTDRVGGRDGESACSMARSVSPPKVMK